MRKAVITLASLFILCITAIPAQAQLFEDFEDGSKGSYAGASVTLSSGDWYMEDALIGSLGNDKFNGSQSVRMDRRDDKNGNIYMQFDKSNGADEVSFYLAHYGDQAEDAALQVQYSVDGGSSWTNLGDEIAAPANLTQYALPVEIDGNIRFKFIQSSGTDRMNIDDIRITDYIEPAEEPTIAVSVEGENVSAGGTTSFSQTSTSSSKDKTIEVKNLGNEPLVISEVTVEGNGFSISDDLEGITLAFNETAETMLTFSPASEGAFQGQLQINSNAVNESAFTLDIAGAGIEDGTVIPISEARQVEFGTRVTVAGRVTVANQFEGPLHIQDGTAAIAVYWPELHTAAEIGDSVQVTGPVTEFNPVDGPQGDFLLQIAEYEGDDDISFEVFDVEKREVTPATITIQQMNSGDYEAQLVRIEEVVIEHSGAFQGETNYDISDRTGEGLIRIDGDANLVGVTAPDEPVTITGVLDQFYGDYQLKPRTADDIGAEEVTYPGEDIPKANTFEVVTWNIEWFGGANGPDDTQQQFTNVRTVIESIDAEIYAFQEISNPTLFATLIDSLEEYGGVLADFTQNQKTAYLFKRSEIDSLDSGVISEGMTSNYWAGGNNSSYARFPLMFNFTATVNGESREVFAFNIHAKAFDDEDSHNQRENASRELKQYLDQIHGQDNVIFLGDYNDTTIGSITNGEESPYDNFVQDPEYTIITRSLEEKGFASQSIGSMIDHITITSELSDEYFEGTERVENTSYIGSYLSTTSDHYPIWTRFQFSGDVSTEPIAGGRPSDFALNQNYPNPFNPTTVISYQLAENSTVTLKVYDMLGREVANLVSGERQAAGEHQAQFDAANLSSGMYIYRLSTEAGQHFTRKMMLIK